MSCTLGGFADIAAVQGWCRRNYTQREYKLFKGY